MAAVVAADSGKPMGKVAALQVFLDHLSNDRPPEAIFSLIPLIVYLHKLLKMISDAFIERRFLRRAGAIYSQLFCHYECYNEDVFDGKSQD